MNLSQFKIGHRVGAGFGALLALTCGVAALGWLELGHASDNVATYRSLARNNNSMSELQVGLLQARVSVKDFLLHPTPERQARVEAELAGARGALGNLIGNIRSPERRRQMAEGQEALERYGQAFTEVASLLAARERVTRQKLDTIGPEAERLLSAVLDRAGNASPPPCMPPRRRAGSCCWAACRRSVTNSWPMRRPPPRCATPWAGPARRWRR
jgi:hypothetical protein